MHPQLPERERPPPVMPQPAASDEIAEALAAELDSADEAAHPLTPAVRAAMADDATPTLQAPPDDLQDPAAEVPLAHSLLDPGATRQPSPTPQSERYQLEGSLGRGGMGHVYAARDDLLGRRVALKRVVPPPGADAAAFEARLLEEARALAAIQHPHVVQVYDLGKDAQGHYLVMELLEGGSLEDRLAGGPLSEKQAVELGIRMCDALEAIHGRGVVHRDIKPANILFDAEGQPKLGDFGLARSEQGPGLTLAGSALGTLAYMAPEQASDAAAVDGRADVYGLGATLYHAVTGDSPRMMRESKLPPRLRGVLLQALEEDPRLRFADAPALRAALEAMHGKPAAPRTATRKPADALQDGLYQIDGLLAENRPAEAIWLSLVWGELRPDGRSELAARIHRGRAAAGQAVRACASCQSPHPTNLLLDGCCEECQLEQARALAVRLRDPVACLAELRRIRERDGAAAAFLEAAIYFRLRPELAVHLRHEMAALRAEESPYRVACGQCGRRSGSNLMNRIRGRNCCPACTERQVLAGSVVRRSRQPVRSSAENLVQAVLTAFWTVMMAPLLLLWGLFGNTRKHVLEDEDADR